MTDVLHWIGSLLALGGATLAIIGAIGVLRFPDVYTRIHAASLTDTAAATLILLGLGLMASELHVVLKLGMVWVFVMLTSPAAAHALAHGAFSSGYAPWIGDFRIVKRQDKTGGRE